MGEKIVYNKLVRDKIPEIIRETGKACTTSILSDEDYKYYLNKKLTEECEEWLEADNVEELADILEVLHAIAAVSGISIEELEKIRADKVERRGAFEQRIFLESVD